MTDSQKVQKELATIRAKLQAIRREIDKSSYDTAATTRQLHRIRIRMARNKVVAKYEWFTAFVDGNRLSVTGIFYALLTCCGLLYIATVSLKAGLSLELLSSMATLEELPSVGLAYAVPSLIVAVVATLYYVYFRYHYLGARPASPPAADGSPVQALGNAIGSLTTGLPVPPEFRVHRQLTIAVLWVAAGAVVVPVAAGLAHPLGANVTVELKDGSVPDLRHLFRSANYEWYDNNHGLPYQFAREHILCVHRQQPSGPTLFMQARAVFWRLAHGRQASAASAPPPPKTEELKADACGQTKKQEPGGPERPGPIPTSSQAEQFDTAFATFVSLMTISTDYYTWRTVENFAQIIIKGGQPTLLPPFMEEFRACVASANYEPQATVLFETNSAVPLKYRIGQDREERPFDAGQLKAALDSTGDVGAQIYLAAFASKKGPMSRNFELADHRAREVKKALDGSRSTIRFIPFGEQWSDAAAFLSKSTPSSDNANNPEARGADLSVSGGGTVVIGQYGSMTGSMPNR